VIIKVLAFLGIFFTLQKRIQGVDEGVFSYSTKHTTEETEGFI